MPHSGLGFLRLSASLRCLDAPECLTGCTSPGLYGRDYMEAFGLPYALILGNHDLEGDEFATDQDNLAAWEQVGER